MANRLLGLFLSSLAITNISFLLYQFETPPVIHLLKIHLPIQYLIPPFIFLYFKAIFEQKMHFRKTYWLHFIPSAYFFIDNLFFYFQSSGRKMEWFNNRHLSSTHHHLLAGLFYLQFAIYIVFIVRILIAYNKKTNALDNYSKTIAKWAKEVLILISILLLINISPLFLRIGSFKYIPLFSSVLYFLILYKVFCEPDIFTYWQRHKKDSENTKKRSALEMPFETESDLNKILMDVIINEKVYRNPEVNLPDLAESIKIPYHQLSRFINTKYKQNFNDFINSKRVDDVKIQLLSGQNKHLTIEAIGRSAGFNSKAAFYNAFKKFENCSPAQFKKAMQKSESLL
jgi:AraC-like DNA-binding protein